MRLRSGFFFVFLTLFLGSVGHTFQKETEMPLLSENIQNFFEKTLEQNLELTLKRSLFGLRPQELDEALKKDDLRILKREVQEKEEKKNYTNCIEKYIEKFSDYIGIKDMTHEDLKALNLHVDRQENIVDCMIFNIQGHNRFIIPLKDREEIQDWFSEMFFEPSSAQTLNEACRKWASIMAKHGMGYYKKSNKEYICSSKAQYYDIDMKDPENIWNFNLKEQNPKTIIAFLKQFFYYTTLVSLIETQKVFQSPKNPSNHNIKLITESLGCVTRFGLNTICRGTTLNVCKIICIPSPISYVVWLMMPLNLSTDNLEEFVYQKFASDLPTVVSCDVQGNILDFLTIPTEAIDGRMTGLALSYEKIE